MEIKQIEDMSNEEIGAELAELAETQFKYRFQHAMGQFDAPSKIRAARKRVARLKTAQRAREIDAATASARTESAKAASAKGASA